MRALAAFPGGGPWLILAGNVSSYGGSLSIKKSPVYHTDGLYYANIPFLTKNIISQKWGLCIVKADTNLILTN